MKTVFLLVQIFFGVLLIACILLQTSKGGLSTDASIGTYRTKRGAEKIIFSLTIISSVLFLIISIANVLY